MSRYIDADGIQYTMLYKENWITNTGLEKQGVWKDDIDKIPTADIRENVRGEWLPDMIYNGEDEWCFFECSNCKYKADKHYNFCPNCGAKMEEKT